ncbi:hypothetical protein BCV69DRAFT_280163 [Microstroma glucosiphilum]|uniref:PX domain-containing protein n=1 Tax=Pseudomicrostroma glucosiphilum TaxID=1684307 RepID=A0A316UJX8_9BASI|nr:hypothetical protein BCV69DRAFT_280163 [Pseudomicrostroma glucosiphilum]PWN24273.1 hypothetical protein BCV69DRAFT_280163 [Pseudomicrostroma glucosiphilum]
MLKRESKSKAPVPQRMVSDDLSSLAPTDESEMLDQRAAQRSSGAQLARDDSISAPLTSKQGASGRRASARPRAGRKGSITRKGPTSRAGPAATKRKGGLFGRLKSMRRKEGEEVDPESAEEIFSESDEATEVPGAKGAAQPSYPSPRETLGISAFQQTRASTSPSAVTGPFTNEDDLESTMSPLRAVASPNGASKGKEAMRLKEPGVAKQPDLVDKPKGRKANPKRYSIAQSVEASLVGPSWSVADRGQVQDEDEDDEDGDEFDEDEEDDEEDDGLEEENYRTDDESRYTPSYWLQDDAGPPMVEGSVTSDWSRVRRAYEEDYDTNTVTTQAPSNAGKQRPVSESKGKKKKKQSGSFYAVEVAGVGSKRRSRKVSGDNDDDDDDEAAHSVVNRLLAKLEADGAEDDNDVDLAAAPISAPVTSNSRKVNGDARKGRGAQGTSLFMPAIAPSVVYGGGDETLIMPDDSVSIRAARRFQQQQEPGAPQLTDPRSASGRQPMTKPQSAQELAAAFAALEPAFIDDEEEDDEIEYEQARPRAVGAVMPSYDDQSADDKDDYTEYDNEVYDDDGFTESYPPASPQSFRSPRSPKRSRQHSRQVSGVTSSSFSSEARSAKRVSNRRRKADRGRNELGRETWLMESALTPEQLHYLVKAMVGVELEWEMQRTFVFDPSRSSSAYYNHRQPPSRGREYAVFRNRELSREDLPQLPLVRFLYDTAFVMLPIFGGGQTPYPKRKAHADAFWKRAVSPMLRLLQSRSLSKRVDRYGEGDGGPFSAQSTLDVLSRSLRQIAVRYITATIQVGEGDVKETWPWPSANMMRLPAFTPYRIPLERQSRGAYEVDVVFVRAQGAQTGYIMTVRKNNGQPHHYVMRTEAQFRDFAKAISAALPKACIKQPPAMEMAQMPGHFRELIRTVDQATVNGSSPDLPAPVASQLQKLGGGSTAELGKRSSKADLKAAKAANAAKQDEASQSTPKLGRIAALKAELRREIRQELNRAKGIPNEEPADGTRNGSDANGRPSNGGERRPSISDSRASFAMSSSTSPGIYDNSPPANDSRATLVDPPAYTSSRNTLGGFFGKRKDDGINYEARRLQLRDWLRDALSARGVGHHTETQAFLGGKTAFTDRDIKKSTKDTMEANRRADEDSSIQRQEVANQAGEEVLDLRDMLEEMWEDCKFSDGFLQAKEVFEEADSFASLPEDYQGVVSYLHLKAARTLDGIFITGSHSAANFRRAKAGFKSVPWKLLMVVMSEPTGMMVNDLKRILTHPSFVTRMTSAVMDDDPRRVEEGLAELKRRLPSDYLRKLRKFVESTPDDVKRVIRDQAEKAGIPLVSAILRGNDAPLLQGRHLQVIVGATKMYQALIDSEPTMLDIEMAARKSREIGLIRDLQHALRLYSARRDGQHLRDIIRSSAFRASFATFVQPILDYVAKLHHRGRPLKEAIRTLRLRTESLLELIEALRSRVQDPARNIDALTTFFDSHAHDTVGIISALTPLFPWLHILAHTVGDGSDDLAREWPLPTGMSGSLYPLEGGALNNLKNIAEAAWLKRIRQMEVCSRWIAGDIEADQDIQVLGGEGEQSRTRQILPEEPLQQRLDRRAFKPFISGFREALSAVLESR